MKRILTIILSVTALFAFSSCKEQEGLDGVRAPLDNTYWEGTYGEPDRHWDYKLKLDSDRDCNLRVIYYVLEGKDHRKESDVTYSGEYELSGSQGTMRLRNSSEPYDEYEDRFHWGDRDLTLEHDGKSVEMHR